MSTILKALRRLEQEKSTRSDRPLGEAVAGVASVPAPQAATSRRWPIFAGIGIGIIVVGVATFAAIQWGRGSAESAPAEVAAIPAEPETPAVPGRAASDRAKAKRVAASRRTSQARQSRPGPNVARELPPEAPIPEVAVVERSQPSPASPLGTRRTPANIASLRSPGLTGQQQPGGSSATPPSGEFPTIDLSRLEELQAAAKSAGKSPESIAAARVAATPPAPAPKSQPTPAPVEVAVARPAPEPVPTSAPSTAPKSEPEAKAEPKAEPKAKAEPEPPLSFARKSPPRPSLPPPPKVYVSRTVWHPDPSRRTAYVEFEGRDEIVALREGESIGPLVVTEIAPTGVSFDNRGSELTRRVGAR